MIINKTEKKIFEGMILGKKISGLNKDKLVVYIGFPDNKRRFITKSPKTELYNQMFRQGDFVKVSYLDNYPRLILKMERI